MDDIMIYYRQQTKFAGVMFLRVSVSRSVHGGCLLWRGACSGEGGACSRGSAPGGGVWRSPVTATAASGTHPTGMHSCSL